MPDLSGITDGYFPVNDEEYSSTLASSIGAGATTVSVVSSSPYTDGDTVVLTVDADTVKQATFKGTKSGSSFIGCKWTEGNVGVGHDGGAPIQDYDSATHVALISAGARVSHNSNGTLKPSAVDTAISSGSIDSAQLAGNIAADKLSTSAIHLGYVETTTPHNTGAVSTTVDITAMNLVVTVPAGGRRLKLTAWCSSVVNGSATGTNTKLAIQEGGTVLREAEQSVNVGDQRLVGSVIYSAVVTAGSHTYKLTTTNTVATNVQYNASANAPIFLLAELM